MSILPLIQKICEVAEVETKDIVNLSDDDLVTFRMITKHNDLFTVDGELRFVSYSDQLFDKSADNPYTPAMIIWPSTMKKEYQDELTK